MFLVAVKRQGVEFSPRLTEPVSLDVTELGARPGYENKKIELLASLNIGLCKIVGKIVSGTFFLSFLLK